MEKEVKPDRGQIIEMGLLPHGGRHEWLAGQDAVNGGHEVRHETVLDHEPDRAERGGLLHELAVVVHRDEYDLCRRT